MRLNNTLLCMSDEQILKANARILYYKLWNYQPKMKDILNNLEYEYRACVFIELAPNAKNCTCTTEVWKAGKWKSAFGIMKKDHIKKAIEDKTIRTRNYIDTTTIKEYFERDTPLHFQFNEIDVIVWHKTNRTEHLVFINSVLEETWRKEFNTPTYKTWFNKDFLPEDVLSDFRYLLDKDNPRLTPPTNVLYKYLKGAYTLSNMNEHYKNKTKEFNSLLDQQEEKKITRLPRKIKKQLKRIQKKVKENKIFSGFTWHPSPAKYFVKKENSLKQKPCKPRTQIVGDRLVCIKSVDEKEFLRIPKKEAIKYVEEKKYKYTTKSAYKKFFLKQEEPLKNSNPFTGANRKIRRNNPDKKKGHSSNDTILQLVNTKGVKNTQVDSKRYLLNDKGNKTTVKTKRKSFEPIYVEVPVEKRIWETDPKTGKVRIKDVVPVMRYIINDKGHVIDKKPLYKRVFDKLEYYYYEYEKFIKVPKHTIITSTFKNV